MGFVLDTWIDSYRTSHAAGLAPMDEYERTYRSWLTTIISRPARVLVAFSPGAEQGADLCGWICYELDARAPARMMRSYDEMRRERLARENMVPVGPLVHFVYVLQAYRNHRIARGLFGAAGIDLARPFVASCKTGTSSQIEHEHKKSGKPIPVRFNPLPVRFPKRNT